MTRMNMRRRFMVPKDRSKYGKRHKPGVMNATEEAYAELLESRRRVGEVVAWYFEPMKLRLAENCFYTPDFLVEYADGRLEMIDAKGGGPIDDKSVVKIKLAAEKFWQFAFAFERKLAKKHGGGWKRTEF